MLRVAMTAASCAVLADPAWTEEVADTPVVVADASQSWFVNLDVQWVSRSDDVQPRSLAGENNGTPGAPADDRSRLSSRDLRVDPVLEPHLTLGYRLDDAWSFEVGYFGISSMNDRVAVASASGDLDVPFSSAYADNFRDASSVQGRYDSELRDIEFNVGYRTSPNTTLLVGVGYIGMYEELRLRAENGQASTYNVATDNNLVGLHVGTDATIPLSTRWAVTARGRLGAFNNRVEYSHVLGDFGDATTLRDSEDSENGFAWRGEIGVAASYSFTPQWMAWAGYRLSYVDNVYLAPDQVDLGTAAASGTELQREGHAFYHGPMIGLIFTFP